MRSEGLDFHAFVRNELVYDAVLRNPGVLGEAAKKANIPLTQTRVGSMLTGFFTSRPVVDWTSAKLSDTTRYGQYFHNMLEQGIYLAPSQFEAAFLSTVHSGSDIEKTVRAAHAAMKSL